MKLNRGNNVTKQQALRVLASLKGKYLYEYRGSYLLGNVAELKFGLDDNSKKPYIADRVWFHNHKEVSNYLRGKNEQKEDSISI